MLQALAFNSLLVSGDPIRSDPGPEFFGMLLRIFLFLLFLLTFCFACGYAWRTLPALRAILPLPQKRVTEPITLAHDDNFYDHTPPKVESYSSEDDTPNITVLSEQPDPLAAALADGRPGSVVKAASDLDGPAPSQPVTVLRRFTNDD